MHRNLLSALLLFFCKYLLQNKVFLRDFNRLRLLEKEKESIVAAMSRNRNWKSGAEAANEMASHRLSSSHNLPDDEKKRLKGICNATSTMFKERCENQTKLMDDLSNVCEKIEELQVSVSNLKISNNKTVVCGIKKTAILSSCMAFNF